MVVLAIIGFTVWNYISAPTSVNASTFIEDFTTGQVVAVDVNNDEVVYVTSAGEKKAAVIHMEQFEINGQSIVEFIAEHNKNNPSAKITLTFNNRDGASIFTLVFYAIMGVVGITLVLSIIRSIGGQNKQATMFGQSKAEKESNIKVRFADVAGAEEEKD